MTVRSIALLERKGYERRRVVTKLTIHAVEEMSAKTFVQKLASSERFQN